MAQMIPTEIFYGKEYDTESGAEMALFKIIKNEPNTKDWICFHSLNIQSHECLTFTEADFVLLIPSRGIFIIEVKGGDIHYRDGRFISVDRHDESHEINPFEQVQKAQFGIINYLKRQNINNVLVATGVAFTIVEFNVESIEYDQSAIYHIGSGSFYDYIVNLERMTKMQHGLYRKDFSGDTFDKVRNLLRGDYDKFVPLYQRVKQFDFSFLKKMYSNAGLKYEEIFAHRMVDMFSILQYLIHLKLIPESISNSTKAFEYFDITVNGRHTAMGDAVATAELYTKLLQYAENKL